jgi:hypothetical protein
MYEAPKLQPFGSFRDLTRVGGTGVGDVSTVHGPDTGCFATSDPDDCVVRAS